MNAPKVEVNRVVKPRTGPRITAHLWPRFAQGHKQIGQERTLNL